MKALIYLLQVSACTGIFYAFYYLFLRRLTFFTLNRWYLLATLLLSFIIPTLTIPVDIKQPSPMMQPVVFVQQMQALPDTPVAFAPVNEVVVAKSFDWMATLQVVYLLIAFLSVAHLLFTLAIFFRRMGDKKLMQIGNIKVIKGSNNLGNSSFLNVIFINEDELEPEEIKQIITHEMLHVKLMHSADRLLARLIQTVLWFNPFAYCYMRSIEENHEFEVDRIAAGDDNKSMYAELLFKLATSGQSYLFHSFSRVPLKTRIAMLFNKPTSNMKKIIYVLVLPVVVISCLAFANLKNNQDKKVSVISGLEKLGPHPLVLINGKEYSDEILYKIGRKSVNGTGLWSPPVTAKKYLQYGNKVKDGVVEITMRGKITYLTAIERENLLAESAVPKTQFYARIKQKSMEGEPFEKALVNMPNGGGMTSSELKPTDKAVFIVEGKIYPEAEVGKVEQILKTRKATSWAVGPVNANQHWGAYDISSYKIYFNIILSGDTIPAKAKVSGAVNEEFKLDTSIGINKYKQKSRLTKPQQIANSKGRIAYHEYTQTEDYKRKKAALFKVTGKTIRFKVIGLEDTLTKMIGRIKVYRVTYGTDQYFLRCLTGQDEQLIGKLNPGDDIDVKVGVGLISMGGPLLIEPLVVIKNNVTIFEVIQKVPDYAFLYEGNRVRYTDGVVTQLQKYPNGKWKSAVIVVNNYNIKLNVKPTAPAFNNIQKGDQVRFRFVHEVKTGAKEYLVNDWVSLSNDIKDYGVKNPDYFYKFYEKI